MKTICKLLFVASAIVSMAQSAYSQLPDFGFNGLIHSVDGNPDNNIIACQRPDGMGGWIHGPAWIEAEAVYFNDLPIPVLATFSLGVYEVNPDGTGGRFVADDFEEVLLFPGEVYGFERLEAVYTNTNIDKNYVVVALLQETPFGGAGLAFVDSFSASLKWLWAIAP